MARRSYYGTKRRTSSRRIVLYIALVAVLALAGKKIYDEYMTRAPEIVVPDDPEVTSENTTQDPVYHTPEPEYVAESEPEAQVEMAAEDDQQGVTQQPVTQPASMPYAPKFDAALKKFADGKVAKDQGKVLESRSLLSAAVAEGLPWEKEVEARSLLNDLAKLWLFSKNFYENDPLCVRYRVQSGDYLATIGKKFKIPFQFIMTLNNISRPENLRADENLKVINGPFHAVVDRSKFMLTIYLGDTICYTWQISTGREGRSTPTGKWMVTKGKKLENPEWTDPDTGVKYLPDDPENPLGERWIGIHGIEGDALGRTGFGIHGTIEPEKIGQPASRGCIRMRNQDVEIVYDMLYGGESTVTIKD